MPGDALSHHTSGYAKTLCSAVFLTGYDAEFAAEHVGYFTGPYEERTKVGKPVVDMVKKTVSITLPNGTVRTAVYHQRPGLHHAIPNGTEKLDLHAEAREDRTCRPPRRRTGRWAIAMPKTPLPAGLDEAKVKAAVDAAFADPAAETTAFVVTWKGRRHRRALRRRASPRTRRSRAGRWARA